MGSQELTTMSESRKESGLDGRDIESRPRGGNIIIAYKALIHATDLAYNVASGYCCREGKGHNTLKVHSRSE